MMFSIHQTVMKRFNFNDWHGLQQRPPLRRPGQIGGAAAAGFGAAAFAVLYEADRC